MISALSTLWERKNANGLPCDVRVLPAGETEAITYTSMSLGAKGCQAVALFHTDRKSRSEKERFLSSWQPLYNESQVSACLIGELAESADVVTVEDLFEDGYYLQLVAEIHGQALADIGVKKFDLSGVPDSDPLVVRIERALQAYEIAFEKSDYFPAEGMEKDSKVLDDNGIVSGVELVAEIVEMFREFDIECGVLSASLRNTRQVRESAIAGAHIATVPFSVIKELLSHHKTMEGMKAFAADTITEYAGLGE